jgi:hypothetical protein
MSKATDNRLAVLKVLGGQSPGYFIFPNASAFIAEGLDPGDVASVLDELLSEGKVERELIPTGETHDDNGDAPEVVPGGFRLIEEAT